MICSFCVFLILVLLYFCCFGADWAVMAVLKMFAILLKYFWRVFLCFIEKKNQIECLLITFLCPHKRVDDHKTEEIVNFYFKLAFPTGRDKGTEVPSMSRDNGTSSKSCHGMGRDATGFFTGCPVPGQKSLLILYILHYLFFYDFLF